MNTPAAVPEPLSVSGTDNSAGEAAVVAAEPGRASPGLSDLPGGRGQEAPVGVSDNDYDEYEPLV